jgi:simple sugar transport system permease protein
MMSEKSVTLHKRFVTLKKRAETPGYLHLLIVLCSVTLAFVFCGILISLMGMDPFLAIQKMIYGAFGSQNKITTTFLKAIPLMLCGLSVSVAFKMRLTNIGAEGQFCIGTIAATGVVLFCDFIPEGLMLPVMLIAAFVAAGLWALISVLPKAAFGVNETITTLMMNYVALFLLDYLIYGPWKDPEGGNMPFTKEFPAFSRLPKLFGTDIHTGLLIAVAAAIILYIVLKNTTWGFQLRVIGESSKSASYAGMNITRNILITMLISGGLAGLAGFAEVSGTAGRMQSGISNDYGFTGIIIAYLSNFNPFTILMVSVLFGGLLAGGYSLQICGLPVQIVTMIQGAILLFVLGGELLIKYKIVFDCKRKGV